MQHWFLECCAQGDLSGFLVASAIGLIMEDKFEDAKELGGGGGG